MPPVNHPPAGRRPEEELDNRGPSMHAVSIQAARRRARAARRAGDYMLRSGIDDETPCVECGAVDCWSAGAGAVDRGPLCRFCHEDEPEWVTQYAQGMWHTTEREITPSSRPLLPG